jgi:hypothetical protein
MFGQYDLIYKSKVFTFTPDNNYAYNCDKEIKGGTGYGFESYLLNAIEHRCPDYSLYDCKHAYGFLTRGCIRDCPWCIVPKTEGNIKAAADIEDFLANYKSAILMDNNVLASPWGIKQIEKIIKLGIKIDFNQGLDARLVDDSIAKLLAKVKWIRYIRFACDTCSQMEDIEKSIKLIRKYSGKVGEYMCYMLVTDDIEDAAERASFLRSLNINAFAQAYRDYENKIIVNRETKEFCRWVNIKSFFKTFSFERWLQIRNVH